MPDVKHKLKLLAIEEEIARLELELCREGGTYLGAKSDSEMDADKKAFEIEILNSVIDEFKTAKLTISTSEIDRANIPNLIGHDPSLKPKTPVKKAESGGGISGFVKKAANAVGKATATLVEKATADPTQIHFGWKIALNTTSATALLGFKSDGNCFFCIYKSDALNKILLADLVWETLWIKPGEGAAFYLDFRNNFKTHFEAIVKQVPPAATDNHARGGSRRR